MPGVQALLTFVLLVIALSLRGAKMPSRGELVEKRLPAAPRPQRLARPAVVLAVVGVVLLIVLPFGYRQSLMLSLVGVVMCLSLVVITGFVGQVSLAQVTLAGVSGFVVSHMFVKADIGFPWGPLVGSVAAVVVGLIVGVSALRVRGVSLAVVTLAGVIAIEQFGFANSRWGAGPNGSPVGQPKLFGTAIGGNASFRGVDGKLPSPVLGFVYLVAVIALCLLVANLRRSLLGQQMLAVRANERAAAAAGINVARVKITAYAISSFIAGTAGWMYAYNFGSVSAARFGILIALGFVAFAYIGGITMVSGAVIGGLVATEGLVPHFFQSILGISGNWTLLVGGLILIVTLIQNPEGVAGTTYRKRQDARASCGCEKRPGCEGLSDRVGWIDGDGQRTMSAVLSARGITVSFGGVHAVVDVDLDVEPGQLVGLIGPNGAGKTTFIDAVTGFVQHGGRVELAGTDISELPPHARARRGLARTWQSIELFDDLSVRENLTVAAHQPSVLTTLKELFARPVARDRAVDEALDLFALGDLAEATPTELTQGQRKLVAVARALAARPKLLCLDEPAAGLDAQESVVFGRHLREIVDRGTPILLVDHDMGLVLGISDRVRRARVRPGDRQRDAQRCARRPEGRHCLPGLGHDRNGYNGAGGLIGAHQH